MSVSASEGTLSAGPVFVVGMNGSGTTMMLDHLGRHPDLYAFPLETYVLPYFLERERSYGDLGIDACYEKLWSDMRSTFPFRRRNAGKPVPLPADWNQGPRGAAAVFDKILRQFANREGKERWAEKTPMHVLHITELARHFPGSSFIHMLRDGRDCAASDHRRWGRHPVATIFRWKQVVEEGRRQGMALGDARYIEFRYEDVTGDPPRYMRAACEFLGLGFDERVLTTGQRRTTNVGQETKTIVRNVGRSKVYFSDARMVELEKVAGSRLLSLGYETRFPHGDSTPSFFTRGWWRLHDTVRIFFRQLWLKFTVEKRVTWSLFFSRLKMIVHSKRAARRSQR